MANEPTVHDCTPLLPIGIKEEAANGWTCPECGAEWFYASGPLEGDWFRSGGSF